MKKAEEKSLNRFLVIWSGQLISSIGNGLTAFSLGVYAFEKTQSATVYSLIILFTFLPSYLLKPIGGTLADRLDRRLMMIIGDLGSALGLVFILIMFYVGIDEMWVIYLGVAASSVFVALQNPAYKASVTDLVEEGAFSKASGLMQLSESSRFLISPIVAGFLLLFMNIEQILIVDIATFIVAVLAVFAVKTKKKKEEIQQSKEDFLASFINGFKYTFSNKGLILLLSIISVITFAVGFLQSLMGPMILSEYSSKTLGIAQTISASGMIASSIFIGAFAKDTGRVLILSVSLAFAGLFYALLGVSTNIVLIIAFGFLFFSTLPLINTSLEVLIRRSVVNEIQGRVWSIVSLVSQLGMILSFSTAGFLAEKVFNPMFQNNGLLASSVGIIIGTGQSRGIGFMFFLSGILSLIVAVIIFNSRTIKAFDHK